MAAVLRRFAVIDNWRHDTPKRGRHRQSTLNLVGLCFALSSRDGAISNMQAPFDEMRQKLGSMENYPVAGLGVDGAKQGLLRDTRPAHVAAQPIT